MRIIFALDSTLLPPRFHVASRFASGAGGSSSELSLFFTFALVSFSETSEFESMSTSLSSFFVLALASFPCLFPFAALPFIGFLSGAPLPLPLFLGELFSMTDTSGMLSSESSPLLDESLKSSTLMYSNFGFF